MGNAAPAAMAAIQLVFEYDGKAVRSGYHVTEVKVGQFSALDCGANPEAWSEIFVQLWNVDDGDHMHMLRRWSCTSVYGSCLSRT